MAAIPYGTIAACRAMKEWESDMKVARTPKYEPKFCSENRKVMEYTPVKYNGKLMNR